MERARSSLLVLHTAVMCAPKALAIQTAKVPTPPAAPMTSTRWPGCRPATSRERLERCEAGHRRGRRLLEGESRRLRNQLVGPERLPASSANEPSATPRTSSPGATPCTVRPTASTVPATSQPRMGTLGRRSPRPSRAKYGRPVMTCHTSGPQLAACTRTTTSCSPATGGSMSLSSSTSADPYRSWTIAFISPPSPPSLCRVAPQRTHPARTGARTTSPLHREREAGMLSERAQHHGNTNATDVADPDHGHAVRYRRLGLPTCRGHTRALEEITGRERGTRP